MKIVGVLNLPLYSAVIRLFELHAEIKSHVDVKLCTIFSVLGKWCSLFGPHQNLTKRESYCFVRLSWIVDSKCTVVNTQAHSLVTHSHASHFGWLFCWHICRRRHWSSGHIFPMLAHYIIWKSCQVFQHWPHEKKALRMDIFELLVMVRLSKVLFYFLNIQTFYY